MERRFNPVDHSKLNESSIEELLCKRMSQLKAHELDEETFGMFMNLCVAEDISKLPGFEESIGSQFLYKMITARVQLYQFSLHPNTTLMLAMVCENPGTVVMYLWYMQYLIKTRFNHLKDKVITMQDFALMFPNGYFSSDDLLVIWDDTKVLMPDRNSANLVDLGEFGKSLLL